MLDCLLDALLDTLKIAAVLLVVNVILSFIEVKLAHSLTKKKSLAPLYGSLFGAIPQCGVSVAASDLYIKNNITIGTLIAVYLSCSDEALPLLIGSMDKKALYAIPLVLIKIVIGFTIGFIIDLIIKNKTVELSSLDDTKTTDCCSIHVHSNHEKLDSHLFHPLLHTLKVSLYVLIINIIFSILMFYFEDNIRGFLEANKYLSPLVSALIGIIPNCASSVIVTELFISSSIGFGALVSGLMMNAGLGFMILFKNKKSIKSALIILLTCFVISVGIGYIISLITTF